MPTARRIAFLRGHEDSVVSLAVTQDSELLASGAEDGGLCIHHLPSFQLVSKLQCSTEESAVGALAWHPKPQQLLVEPQNNKDNNSSSSSSAGGRLLFAGVGRELLVLLLTPGSYGFSSSSNGAEAEHHAIHQPHAEPIAAAAAADDVAGGESSGTTSVPNSSSGQVQHNAAQEGLHQLRVLLRLPLSTDDLSSLSVNTQGTYLAAADDTGDVLLLDIHKLQQQHLQQQQLQHPPPPSPSPSPKQQQQHMDLLPCRTIAGAHHPMATAVAFRGSHKPWQLLSGGVDNRVALWDFSRPKKCISSWNMQHMAGVHPPGDISASGGGAQADSNNNTQVSSKSSSRSRGRNNALAGSTPEQQQPQLWNPPMVHDLELPWSLPKPQRHGRSCGNGNSCPGSSSSSKLEDSVMAGVAKGVVAVARGDGTIAVFDANPDAKPSTKQQQQRKPCNIPPGFHVCLDQARGGHSLPAACVCFMPWESGCRYLWSAGQDHRLLLWDWTAALLECAPAAGVAGAAGASVCRGSGGGGAEGDKPRAVQAGLQKQQQEGNARAQACGTATAAADEGRQKGQQEVPADGAAAQTGPASDYAGAGAGIDAVDQSGNGSKCLLLEKQHQRKVNAMCSCWEVSRNPDSAAAAAYDDDNDAVLLIVADTASRMAVYRVKL